MYTKCFKQKTTSRHSHSTIYLGSVYMTPFSTQKWTFGLRFGLLFTCKWWKRILKMETFESRDLSGDHENGYLKNGWLFMCKHQKMETYFWYRCTLAFILTGGLAKALYFNVYQHKVAFSTVHRAELWVLTKNGTPTFHVHNKLLLRKRVCVNAAPLQWKWILKSPHS